MHPLLPRAGAAIAVTLGLAITACSSDQEATPASRSTTTTAPSVDDSVEPFCDAYLELSRAVSGPPSDDIDVAALAADLEAKAPADLRADVATFLEVGQRAASTEDEQLFVSDEYRDPARAVDAFVAGSCGRTVVEVSAVDHGFVGVPPTLPAGPAMFHFVNEGAELHEGILLRPAEGVAGDPVELVNADPSGESGDLEEVGVAYIGPAGDEAYLSADLEPGAYVLVCFFPQGVTSMAELREDDGSTSPELDHRSAGMVVGFEVAGT